MEELEPLAEQIQSILEVDETYRNTKVVIYSEEPYGVANDFREVLNVFVPTPSMIRLEIWSLI